MDTMREYFIRDRYFGYTNPGIYTGEAGTVLLLYSLEGRTDGSYFNGCDAVCFRDGDYYIRHAFSDRTAGGFTFYPLPRDLPGEDGSLSFGELAAYCGKLEPSGQDLMGEWCREVSLAESLKHGYRDDRYRYWKKDDRIAFLHRLSDPART